MASAWLDVPLVLRYDTSYTTMAEVWLAQELPLPAAAITLPGHIVVELVDDDGVANIVHDHDGEAHAADVPGPAQARLDPHHVLCAADPRRVQCHVLHCHE